MFVTPFLTTVLGFVMMGEVPDPSTMLGGIIILLGLFLFNKENLLEPLKNRNLVLSESVVCKDNENSIE